MLDRRERLKKLKQPVNPHEPVRIPESLCLKPTNVNVLWMQQQLYVGKFWCAVAKNKPIGLVQRSLFSFGFRTHRHDSRLNSFHEHIFLPIVKKLFRFTVKELGPKTPKANKVVFNLPQNHMDMVSRVEQTLSMLGPTKSYSRTLRDAMPMCLYWLGTGRTTMTNGLHSNFNAHVYGGLDTRVTDASFKGSLNFVARRFVRGIAVLSTSVQEELWATYEETAVGHADDLMRMLMILRKTPGPILGTTSICSVDLLFRRTRTEGKQATRSQVQTTQRFADLGLGRYMAEAGMADSSPILVKFPRDNLSAAGVCWLPEHGVPLSQFGPNERKQNDNLEELIEPAAISLRTALSSVEQKDKEDENLDKLIQLASNRLDTAPSQAVLKAGDKYQIVDPLKENAQMVSGRDLQQDGGHHRFQSAVCNEASRAALQCPSAFHTLAGWRATGACPGEDALVRWLQKFSNFDGSGVAVHFLRCQQRRVRASQRAEGASSPREMQRNTLLRALWTLLAWVSPAQRLSNKLPGSCKSGSWFGRT